MATAKKLPSGSWRCQVFSHLEPVFDANHRPIIDPKTNKQKQKRIYRSFTSDTPGPKGKREAEQLAASWAANKESLSKCSLTMSEAIDKYIATREAVLSPRTIMDYKRIRKYDLQGIMNIRVDRITQEDIQREINIDAQIHSPKTVRNNHGLISAVLHQYRPEFVLNTSLPKKKKPELYVPTDADVQKIIDAVKGTDMELPVLLAAFGPMRRGEICALHSDNIQGNVVHVCENMVYTEDKEWIIKQPKSDAGDRYIEFPDFVAEKFKGRSGRIVNLTPGAVTSRFCRILKQTDTKHFRFHDLRHYCASIQHALGIPDAYIMQRGGWGNDAVLKSVYRHALEDREIDMNKIANDHFSDLCNTKCNTNFCLL